MKKTALITGASSGIGYEMTKYFAQDGYNMVLVARSEQALRQLAGELEATYGVSVHVLVKDLAQPDAPDEIFNYLQQAGVHIDVLVNNAGYGSYGEFTQTDLTKEMNMLQVNIMALTHLSKLFIREMVKKREGKVLNVASTASFQPGPLMAAYYASKAYVLSLSEALSFELRDSGVTVSALCPGPTTSKFQEVAGMQKSKLLENATMDSDSVAKIGYFGLMNNQTVIIPGTMNKLGAISVRLMPRKLVPRIVHQMQSTRQ